YSFTPSLEDLIKPAGFSATLPTDKVTPTLGVYLTEQNPSKMGWYITRSTKSKQRCTDSAPYKYQVEYTLEN
ncbi:chemotaxis protein, partial [Bifidobacterium animalis]|nr:chemotaxis protein [Bifidobacterium animalis]